jgi:hypothetical protein
LRKTTSGAAGIGLGTTIKYPRQTKGAAAGNGPGAAQALRPPAGRNDQILSMHNERHREQRPGHHDK